MPMPVATTITILLNAIKVQLFNVFNQNSVYLGLTPQELDAATADNFAVITLSKQTADAPIIVGTGNVFCYVNATFSVTVWCRLQLDAELRADIYLTDPVLGLWTITQRTINALQLYQPLDTSGNQLLAEPMRFLTIDQPKRDVVMPGWGYVTILYDLPYQMNLSN